MTTTPGFSSEKIPRRGKIPSLLSDKGSLYRRFTESSADALMAEVRVHLLSLSLLILGMEAFVFYGGALTGSAASGAGDAASVGAASVDISAFPRGSFVLAAILFFFFFAALEYLFAPFTGDQAAALVPLLPAALLFFLLKRTGVPPLLPYAVAAAAVMRLFFVPVRRREKALLYGIFVPDLAAGVLCFAGHALTGRFPTDKLLWIILAVMTLSALQALLGGKKGDAFPFSYFALLGLLLLVLPMGPKPIDWTPVVRAGERIVRIVTDTADSVTYHLSSVFDDGTYAAGYSSLDVSGGKISRSGTTQLLLKTDESPYYVYRDGETSGIMRMRRTVYLAGGRGPDRLQLVSFLKFLYECGVDRDYAALFSQISQMDVEYAFLDTPDEIAPTCSLLLTSGDKAVLSGVSASRHKKGYEISALYLDLDYGSPYLTALFRNVTGDGSYGGPALSEGDAAPYGTAVSGTAGAFSYEEACRYMEALYGVDLGAVLTQQEFAGALRASSADVPTENAPAKDSPGSYIGTEGASGRMAELADGLTEGAGSAYDKCKRIEDYIRQYTYDTNAVGGHDPRSDLRTAEGMSDIADRFLFETGAGYCVHSTASMVMLLRLAGIPARAVSGFRYAFPFEQKDAYEVTGSCAHIWPEAYLTGVGWVPFEPTSAYRTAAEYTWHRKADPAVAGKYGFSGSASDLPDSGSAAIELPPYAGPSTGEAVPGGPSSEGPPYGDPGAEKQTAGELALQTFRIALPVFLCIAGLLAAIIAGAAAADRLRYRRGTPEKRLMMDVEKIKKRIRQLSGEDFTDRGLLTDYADRAPEELRTDLLRVFRAYYRVLYGGGAVGAAGVTLEESALAATLRDTLLRRKK